MRIHAPGVDSEQIIQACAELSNPPEIVVEEKKLYSCLCCKQKQCEAETCYADVAVADVGSEDNRSPKTGSMGAYMDTEWNNNPHQWPFSFKIKFLSKINFHSRIFLLIYIFKNILFWFSLNSCKYSETHACYSSCASKIILQLHEDWMAEKHYSSIFHARCHSMLRALERASCIVSFGRHFRYVSSYKKGASNSQQSCDWAEWHNHNPKQLVKGWFSVLCEQYKQCKRCSTGTLDTLSFMQRSPWDFPPTGLMSEIRRSTW